MMQPVSSSTGNVGLSWLDINGILPQDWGLLVDGAERHLATAVRLHQLRSRTGKLALQRAYERSLRQYEDSLRLLVRFAPDYLSRLASAARFRATQLEMEINMVWEEPETDFESLCQKVDRHLRLLGQLKALEAVVAGVETTQTQLKLQLEKEPSVQLEKGVT